MFRSFKIFCRFRCLAFRVELIFDMPLTSEFRIGIKKVSFYYGQVSPSCYDRRRKNMATQMGQFIYVIENSATQLSQLKVLED